MAPVLQSLSYKVCFTLLPIWHLATVIQTKENATLTKQKMALLLNGWPRTITETMATATKFMKFSNLIVLFSL